MTAEMEEPKVTVYVISESEAVLGVLMQHQFSLKAEESFSNQEAILLYPSDVLAIEERQYKIALEFFQEKLSSLGDIKGKFVYVWVDSSDAKLEEDLIEKLKLKERGCVWKFGAGEDYEEVPKIEQFFKENLRQVFLKPAKRD